jgi:sulfite reductase (NADPH) flavoprotein alpha-component
VAETCTFADLLGEFTSARPSVGELIQLVPRIKARLYSIASSSKANPNKVELLVVLEDWKTPDGKYKMGLCSDYLERMVPGTKSGLVTASVSSSLMKLPADPLAPIVMAGTGTGMAPFRAFLQERHFLATKQGKRTGDSVLYFGARYSSQEYLYKDELQGFERDGTLTHFRPAWSRDQAQKVYIQHRIAEDAEVLWTLLHLKRGSFYLCGQAGKMPGDVYDAIANGFAKAGKITLDEARKLLSDMKEEGRYVVEVY